MVLKDIHDIICRLLFPGRCPVCDRVMTPEDAKKGVCDECRDILRPIREPVCFKCGASLKAGEDEYCRLCRGRRHYYDKGRALYEYSSVRRSIYRFKYNGRTEYAYFFGREMARQLGPLIKSWGTQALIPVPLYPAKKRQRGYNQAYELAKVIGVALNIPVEDKMVRRVVKTRPMKLLNAKERQINLKNAFNIIQDVVKSEVVVIVDDIYTTGSTIDAMAKLLKEAGVKKVYYVTLSIGSGD